MRAFRISIWPTLPWGWAGTCCGERSPKSRGVLWKSRPFSQSAHAISLDELYAVDLTICLTCSASRMDLSTTAGRAGSFVRPSNSTLKNFEISNKLVQRLQEPPGFRGKFLFRGQSIEAFHACVPLFDSQATCGYRSRCVVDRYSRGTANAGRNHGRSS